MKKTNVILGILIFVLAAAIIAINVGFSNAEQGDGLEKPAYVETLSTTGKIVVLDAGHGGEDGGASIYGGTPEKELNLLISYDLRDMLEAVGFKVVMTRTEDVLLYDKNSDYHDHKKSMDLANRLKIARATPGAILVSIHMNAFPETKYSGLQVYYSKNDQGSRELALAIQEINKSIISPANDRKIKQAGSNIYLLDRFENPAVLIECGFLSNDEEREKLNSPEYRQKLATCFLSAIMKYTAESENNIK
jgi:N-acetylmuramoyl-L-alanine amidase